MSCCAADARFVVATQVAAINDNLRQKCRENEALQAELQAMKSALLAAVRARALVVPCQEHPVGDTECSRTAGAPARPGTV